MRRGRLRVVLSLLLLAGAIAAVVVVASDGGSGPLFGVNESAGGASYKMQAALGMPIRRTMVGWDRVEPAPGVWRWSETDATYDAVLSAGLRPLFVAVAPPCWTHPSVPCSGPGAGAGAPPDPGYDAAWSAFLTRLAKRYPHLAGVEIFNEENAQPQFLPYPNARRYTELLQEAYRAVKSVSKVLPVISGGLFASPISGPYAIADEQFLSAMYHSGAKGFMDGIGIHPYPADAGTAGRSSRYDLGAFDRALARVRAARAQAHDASTPIWITEMGVATQAYRGSPPALTEAEQARDLLAMVHTVRRDGDIEVAIIHRLLDPPPALADPDAGNAPGFGLFRSDGSPKSAACRLSREFHGNLVC